ncbi:hypothetical protein [Streptomyces sp. XD-27]|uniref:hypothetical protein n=1 Tax=Streptomyces sp. XD-27 TaxID=3062779 RepID=UPI0026F4462A|nr:hypothetical protein [Streptomyces sp. XD-27]WKX70578.1 hypothetical protein Q3Y56_12230 [Streptomyces sp. XD-27]
MTARHRPHRRTTATVLAAATLALGATLTTGCDGDSVRKAVDCGRLALEISNDIDDLQKVVLEAALDPDEADKILDTLDKDIDKLKDKTDNADVSKALDDLQEAVDNAQKSIDKGEKPDLTPVKDAAGELTNVCT